MPFMPRLYRSIARFATRTKWSTLLLIMLVHASSSYLVVMLCGETDLLNPITFYYFYTTTITTIGYGDLSASTQAGMFFIPTVVYTFGLLIATAILTKLAYEFSNFGKKLMQGRASFEDMKNHIILVGYHKYATPRMLDEIFSDQMKHEVVLISETLTECPDERVEFVATEALSEHSALKRAGIMNAAKVLIYGRDDEHTTGAALSISALNPNIPIVCHINDPKMGEVLKSHVETASVVQSTTVSQMVRELQAPGSATILSQLSSPLTAATINSTFLTKDESIIGSGKFDLLEFVEHIEKFFEARMVAWAPNKTSDPQYTLPDAYHSSMTKSCVVYYISTKCQPNLLRDYLKSKNLLTTKTDPDLANAS